MDPSSLDRIAQLERHIDWLRKHIGCGEILDRRVAEVSETRAYFARVSRKRVALVLGSHSPSDKE